MTVRAREGEDEDYDKRWVCKVGRSGAPELLRSCGGVCECVVALAEEHQQRRCPAVSNRGWAEFGVDTIASKMTVRTSEKAIAM